MKAHRLGSSGGQPRAAQKRNHEGERRARAAQKGNHKGRQAWEKAAAATKSSPEGKSCRETRRQRQPRAAQKGNHEGRQGGSGNQEQPRREIMKGDKLGDKAAAAAKSSPEEKS